MLRQKYNYAPIKNISGTRKSTSNFKTHLKRLHADTLPEFEQHKIKFNHAKKKHILHVCSDYKPTKASSVHYSFSQRKVDDLITSYVVKGMHPLSTVDSREFIELVQGLNPETRVFSRRTLG